VVVAGDIGTVLSSSAVAVAVTVAAFSNAPIAGTVSLTLPGSSTSCFFVSADKRFHHV
jgi:hypothetical protein